MTSRERVLATRAGIAANRQRGLKTYKFPAGTTLFRILPTSASPGEPFERKYGMNHLKTFDGKGYLGVVDRSITYDEPSDPVRDLIWDAWRQAPDDDTKKHYKDMVGGARYLFNALILSHPKEQSPEEPVLIEVSETAFDSIMTQFLIWSEEDPEYDLAALDTGHVFSVEKTGQGMDTRYTFNATPKKAPLDAKILDKVIDIDAWIKNKEDEGNQKALAFLGQINGSIGITTSTPAQLTAANVTSGASTAAAASQPNVSAAAVTTAIEPDEPEVEDAVVEELAAEIVAETPAAAAVETPAAAAPAADAAGIEDIDAILASLG